ncbi:MAG: hypothetical protein KDC39_14400 [Actinobacteria bacterium]|nr:hypothetical protein [Actinomycetota bacterium]HRY10195.1 hypothetical protein [Candidatus Nanopelagicales bacterium]
MSRPGLVVSGRRVPRGLWWLSPAGAVLFVTLPTLWLATALEPSTYLNSWQTPKYLTTGTAALILIGALVFMATSGLMLLRAGRADETRPWPRLPEQTLNRLGRAAEVCFWITLVGYAAWGAVGLANGATPAVLLEALVSQNLLSGDIKDMFPTVPGITTLTQVGVAYVVVTMLILVHRPQRGVAWRLALLFLLALFRTYFLTERVALLELAIPIVAILAMAFAGSPRQGVRVLVRLLPVAFVPAVMAVFGLFEYSRSWQYYQQTTGGTFLDFSVDRLAGYYATSYNNGQIAINWEHFPGRIPLRTLDAVWEAPGIAQAGLYDKLSPEPNAENLFFTLLQQKGNIQFNNPCGICDPFVDYGSLGGLVWLAAAGVILGLIYRSFCNGSLWALLLYPPMVTGLFELPRYLYWTQGRWIPALAALLLIAWYARPRGSPPTPVPASADGPVRERT